MATTRRPRRTGPPPNAARDDVGDFGPAPTTRKQREMGEWAKQTRQQLETRPPTAAERAAKERELREDFTERAAIFEYLGGMPRADAELAARKIVYGSTTPCKER
jgi:hypothetical protein